jgi:uncharacterized protein (TIGR02722 family)
MKKKQLYPGILTWIIFGIVIVGCATQVRRINPETQTDLSGRWNDTDSRLVAEEMTEDLVKRPWLKDFNDSLNRRPVMVVGIIKNKSHEHIAVDTFIRDIERELINMGTIRIVQAGTARDELRAERSQQQDFASAETTKRWANELGADFILQGLISSIVDTSGKESAVFYQVDLELTNIESSEKVWIGTKKIKKLIRR